MRLDKLLAHCGFGSRRDVKQLIRQMNISVNGKQVDKPNLHVNPSEDKIIVNGEQVIYEKYIYLMLNKPDGYISATEDLYDLTVIDLVPEDFRHFDLFPVGRLDKDTEGLLLLTNDGKVNHYLTSPKHNVKKVYYATIQGEVTKEDIERFAQGVVLDDGYKTKPAQLHIIKSDDQSEIELTITEGKFHQVKRMFLAINKQVLYLKRIQMGEIRLDHELQLGHIRRLNEAEMQYINSVKKR